MDKRPIGYQPGKGSILDKKVPKTNKYDHVESKLAGKTGTTVKDIEFMSTSYHIKAINKYLKRTVNCFEELSQPHCGKC